jgi:chromosomal replication initiator protein
MNYIVVPGLQNRKKLSDSVRYVKSEEIIKAVEEHFSLTLSELKKKSRRMKVAYPRQVLMYFLYNHSLIGCVEIGRMFNKHHTTVLNANKSIQNFIDTEENRKAEIIQIMSRFN